MVLKGSQDPASPFIHLMGVVSSVPGSNSTSFHASSPRARSCWGWGRRREPGSAADRRIPDHVSILPCDTRGAVCGHRQGRAGAGEERAAGRRPQATGTQAGSVTRCAHHNDSVARLATQDAGLRPTHREAGGGPPTVNPRCPLQAAVGDTPVASPFLSSSRPSQVTIFCSYRCFPVCLSLRLPSPVPHLLQAKLVRVFTRTVLIKFSLFSLSDAPPSPKSREIWRRGYHGGGI